MFRKRIRKIFFFLILSSVFTIITSFSVPEQMTQEGPLQFLGKVKQGTQEISQQAKDLDVKQMMKARSVDELKKIVGDAQSKSQENSAVYEIKGQKYVFISGKYYLYRSDNTYMVDGVSMFYKDNSRNRYNGVEEAERELATRKTGTTKSGRVIDTKTYKPKFGLKALSPSNMAEMMKGLNRAQENMKQRNEALDELMEQ